MGKTWLFHLMQTSSLPTYHHPTMQLELHPDKTATIIICSESHPIEAGYPWSTSISKMATGQPLSLLKVCQMAMQLEEVEPMEWTKPRGRTRSHSFLAALNHRKRRSINRFFSPTRTTTVPVAAPSTSGDCQIEEKAGLLSLPLQLRTHYHQLNSLWTKEARRISKALQRFLIPLELG